MFALARTLVGERQLPAIVSRIDGQGAIVLIGAREPLDRIVERPADGPVPDGRGKRYQEVRNSSGLTRSTMQLLRRIDVWRAHSPSRAICYNCVENLRTGRFRVCTADFVESGATRDASQERYFVEQIVDWSPDDPEQPEWFETLEAAIAAHDADFEN